MATESISYEDFKQAYLEEFTNLSPVEKGHLFAQRILKDFKDSYELPDSIDEYFCDGPGDGGIDIVILDRQEDEEDQQEDEEDQQGGVEGDTWYLIQSKYNQPNSSQLRTEAEKIFAVLTDKHEKRLSYIGEDITQRLKHFLKTSSNKDRLIIVFLTQDPIEQDSLDQIRKQREHIFSSLHFDVRCHFKVQNFSIKDIYNNLPETQPTKQDILNLHGCFQQLQKSQPNNNFLVGTVTLEDLYNFLKKYASVKNNNVDLIYEDNIRQYLAKKSKVNEKIHKTLEKNPTKFGLYNNGITLIVEEYTQEEDHLKLTNPRIINGCQTTRSIFEVLDREFDSGGTSKKSNDPKFENWKREIKESSIVVKIIEVAQSDSDLINNITQYTNTQNAMKKADFNSLKKSIRSIQKQFNDQYSKEVYLELHRGGWEVEKNFRQSQGSPLPSNDHVTIDELLKIYGSGWFQKPGAMFKNPAPIRPGGNLYRKLFEKENTFGFEDFYAAYLLKQTRIEKKFDTKKIGKMQYLYYFVVMDLLRYVLKASNTSNKDKNMTEEKRDNNERSTLTKALIKIFKDEEAKDELLKIADEVIDTYLDEEDEEFSIHEEKNNKNDMTSFLGQTRLGKEDFATNLTQLLGYYKKFMQRKESGYAMEKMTNALEA